MIFRCNLLVKKALQLIAQFDIINFNSNKFVADFFVSFIEEDLNGLVKNLQNLKRGSIFLKIEEEEEILCINNHTGKNINN